MANSKRSEAQILENYRVTLTNIEIQPAIAPIMADYGYDAAAIALGKQLLETTRSAFDFTKKESQESNVARAAFEQKSNAISAKYSTHRKKAKVVFRNDEVILKNLGLTGSMPQSYINKMETLKVFYTSLQADTALLNRLLLFKVLPADVTDALALIAEVEAARAAYLIEVGESQSATKSKDAAFAAIDTWMSDFTRVAKIAMEDNPQLLESLGIFVRS